MKQMFTWIAAALIGSALVVPAMAQDAGPGRQGGQGQGQGGPRGERMPRVPQQALQQIETKVLAELNLNEPQKAAVRKLNEDMQKKQRELREKFGMPAGQAGQGQGGQRPQMDPARRREMMQEMRKLNEWRRGEMKKILGDAKFATYEKRMQEEIRKWIEENRNRQGGQGGGQGRGGNQGPTR